MITSPYCEMSLYIYLLLILFALLRGMIIGLVVYIGCGTMIEYWITYNGLPKSFSKMDFLVVKVLKVNFKKIFVTQLSAIDISKKTVDISIGDIITFDTVRLQFGGSRYHVFKHKFVNLICVVKDIYFDDSDSMTKYPFDENDVRVKVEILSSSCNFTVFDPDDKIDIKLKGIKHKITVDSIELQKAVRSLNLYGGIPRRSPCLLTLKSLTEQLSTYVNSPLGSIYPVYEKSTMWNFEKLV